MHTHTHHPAAPRKPDGGEGQCGGLQPDSIPHMHRLDPSKSGPSTWPLVAAWSRHMQPRQQQQLQLQGMVLPEANGHPKSPRTGDRALAPAHPAYPAPTKPCLKQEELCSAQSTLHLHPVVSRSQARHGRWQQPLPLPETEDSRTFPSIYTNQLGHRDNLQNPGLF